MIERASDDDRPFDVIVVHSVSRFFRDVLESTVHYLGIEVDSALHIAERIELQLSNPTYPPVVTGRSLEIHCCPDAWPAFFPDWLFLTRLFAAKC